MKITEEGQITIPRSIREDFGLRPDTEVEVVVRDGAIVVVKREDLTPGEQLVASLRSVKHTSGVTTDEIMKMTRGRRVGGRTRR